MAEKRQKRFSWNENLCVILCKELLTYRPYQYRSGTKESARCWEFVVERLSNAEEYRQHEFPTKTKSYQDKIKTLIENRKDEVRKQERESGTVVEDREIDILLDNIISDKKDCVDVLNDNAEASRQRNEEEQNKAEDVRKTAMESLGESRKRRASSSPIDETPQRKPRRSGHDTLEFIAVQSEEKRKQREDEMNLRREEMEERRKSSETSNTMIMEMMRTMQQQQQQQFQLQQQQFQAQQNQQQQQNLLVTALIEKLNR